MQRVMKTAALAGALLFLSALSARAEDKVPTDAEFVAKALAGGVAEVKYGEMAGKRSANDEVKKFAQLMQDDHGKANRELMEHAKNLKIAVAQGLTKKDRETLLTLFKAEGADFDRKYMDQQIAAHEEAVSLF